jgi:hypothetical protein
MQFCVFEEMFQDCPAKGVVLALENICPAAPLRREVKPADAGK